MAMLAGMTATAPIPMTARQKINAPAEPDTPCLWPRPPPTRPRISRDLTDPQTARRITVERDDVNSDRTGLARYAGRPVRALVAAAAVAQRRQRHEGSDEQDAPSEGGEDGMLEW